MADTHEQQPFLPFARTVNQACHVMNESFKALTHPDCAATPGARSCRLALVCHVLAATLVTVSDMGAVANAATSGPESFTYIIQSPPYQISQLPNGYHRIVSDGCGNHASAPGYPALPSRNLRLAVPPDTDLDSISITLESEDVIVIPGDYDIQPLSVPVPVGGSSYKRHWPANVDQATGKDRSAYSSNTSYPGSFVAPLPYSQMRKWKMARCEFSPFQYNPVTKQLLLLRSGTIRVTFARLSSSNRLPGGSAPAYNRLLHDNVMDKQAAELILNLDQAAKWYVPPTAALDTPSPKDASGNQADYVIITTSSITNNLRLLPAFIAHLQRLGHSVRVVTELDYASLTGQAPNTTADKIRQWLKDNYINLGIQYVLLMGNPDPSLGDVPMKVCFPLNGEAALWGGDYAPLPTDSYYANLSGNWDLNGDGTFGECGCCGFPNDTGSGGFDLAPEVYVGRVPIYGTNDYARADLIMLKTVAYAYSSAEVWRKRMLLPMAVTFYESENGGVRGDGQDMTSCIVPNVLDAAGFSHWVCYEKEGVSPTPDTAPYDNSQHSGINETNVLNEWSKGYGGVFWEAHGLAPAAFRTIWTADSNGNGVTDRSEVSMPAFFSLCDTARLNNETPSIVCGMSCDEGWPEDPCNLGFALLSQGAIGTVFASRLLWIYVDTPWNPNDCYAAPTVGYNLFKRIIVNQETTGSALSNARSAMCGSFGVNNAMANNLYGDPSLALIITNPPTPPALSVQILTPAANQVFATGGEVNLGCQTSNQTGTASVQYYARTPDVVPARTLFLGAASTPPYSLTWALNGVLPGDWEVVAVAVDGSNQVASATRKIQILAPITVNCVVSTLAGSASGAGSTDGSPGQFNGPRGVAVDSTGNVFVADYGNSTIRKVSPSGVVSTLAGLAGTTGSADGTGSSARFNYPFGIAVDSAGIVYVGDGANNTVRKVTPDGTVSTLAGLAGNSGSADGTGSGARFSAPRGVAVDSAGSVFVADSGNNTIRKITPVGVVTTIAGLAGAAGSADGACTDARFNGPRGLAFDAVGNLYVGDDSNQTVRVIAPSGTVSTLAGLAGTIGTSDGVGSDARFNNPCGVAVDPAGNLYVADFYNHTIRLLTPASLVMTLAGAAGAVGNSDGAGRDARFDYPWGIAADAAGNLYVGDDGNNAIRKISLTFSTAQPYLSATWLSSNFILSWPGNHVLQTATNVTGPYVDIPSASSPFKNAIETTGSRFFRLR